MKVIEGNEEWDEFVLQYGRAMLGWQRVENELFYIYWNLNPRSKYEVASAFYEAVVGLSARVAMIDAGVAIRYEGDDRAERWKKLSTVVRKRIRDRNVLAHWTFIVSGPDSSPHLGRPNFYFQNKRDKNKRRVYSFSDIKTMQEEFSDLAFRLWEFVEEMDVDE
jgi:hypothetical protein